jgi:hypothetical protein
MPDYICRKTMMSCQQPGMCSPHGGCITLIASKSEPEGSYQKGYDEGRRQGTHHRVADIKQLEASRAADKARIDELESALGILTKAVKELRAATPLLHCELFHHKRLDQHSSDAECPPFERWCVAAMAVTEALAKQEQQ